MKHVRMKRSIYQIQGRVDRNDGFKTFSVKMSVDVGSYKHKKTVFGNFVNRVQ